ncbi:MAG TPA: hypothetical protein VLV89_03935 [Candidatus Acidoferrum sp.]|nr:hypothetical protein [Candidatus Acidoferrum sp.]
METVTTPKLMRLKSALALLAILFLGCHAPAQLKPYDFPADGFRASFPSKPELSKDTVPEGQLTFEIHYYIATEPISGATLMAAVTDFGNHLDGRDPDGVLQGAENGALANSKSHLVGAHKQIFLGANHGVAFEAESDEAHLSIRLYLVGGMLYQEVVVSPKSKKYDTAATQRFLDSFQLIARQ